MRNIVFICIVLFICSCGLRRFSFKQDYNEDRFSTDGFYYSDKKRLFIFYKNGVMIDCGSGHEDVKRVKTLLRSDCHFDYLDILPYYWGVFLIKDDNIRIEKWRSGDAFGGYPIVDMNGRIINDSTIILKYVNSKAMPDTFRFSKYKFKPDSINNFIK